VTNPDRILFFTHSARAFTSSLIGHLYEVSQEHPVILLTESLPDAYVSHLQNKDLFPMLEQVHIVDCLGFTVKALVRENSRWLRLARQSLDAFSPSVVIGENDMSSLFDMYLMREAKRRGVKSLTIQSMGEISEFKIRRFFELRRICPDGKRPAAPIALWRKGTHRTRKALGHFLVHYLLPWFAGHAALRGPSSYVLRTGAPGMRDTGLHLVQSAPQHKVFIRSRVPSAKLAILRHPAERVPLEAFFPPGAARPGITDDGQKKILVLMATSEFGFERETLEVISSHDRRQLRLAITEEISRCLPDWQLIIKPHPDFGSIQAAQDYLGPLPANATLVPPGEPVEPLLLLCDAVLDLPPPNTSTLVTASSALPGKPVIAADLDHDILGDQFREWPEIEYVDEMQGLTRLLARVGASSYQRQSTSHCTELGVREFGSTNQAIRFVVDGGAR
jgi:hypothetical protein